jgi:hypothetical protein
MRKASASSSCRGVLCCAREIERERERELGDDEGFVRSVGGLGDAQ